MYNVILVGLGGFVGSVGRYLTYLLISTYFNHPFPVATLLVNCVGCFAIGALTATAGHYMNPRVLLLLSTGSFGDSCCCGVQLFFEKGFFDFIKHRRDQRSLLDVL